MILNSVKKYLALNKHLALPGIGGLVVETQPPTVDFINRSVKPVQSKILFTTNTPPPEKEFYDFLANELSTDEARAVHAFNDFAATLQQELNEKSLVYFKGIGTLKKQDEEVKFQPEIMPVYFPEITAERIARKHAPHKIRVGEDDISSHEMQAVLSKAPVIKQPDKWWIAAAILASIGIAAIIFYYAV